MLTFFYICIVVCLLANIAYAAFCKTWMAWTALIFWGLAAGTFFA